MNKCRNRELRHLFYPLMRKNPLYCLREVYFTISTPQEKAHGSILTRYLNKLLAFQEFTRGQNRLAKLFFFMFFSCQTLLRVQLGKAGLSFPCAPSPFFNVEIWNIPPTLSSTFWRPTLKKGEGGHISWFVCGNAFGSVFRRKILERFANNFVLECLSTLFWT